MALVTKFEPDDREIRSLHPTQVACRYIFAETDGQKILQLNTYGSSMRQHQDKLSQTIQLDENTAKQLLQILQKEFSA